MSRFFGPALTLAILVSLSGCSNNSSGPSAVFDPAGGDPVTVALGDVALESDLMADEMISTEFEALGGGDDSAAQTKEKFIDLTRKCPGGGTIRLEGSVKRTSDGTGLLEGSSSGVRTMDECTFVGPTISVTIDGTSAWEWTRRYVDGRPDGPQTFHFFGDWTAVSSAGDERACKFDYTVTRDPAAGERTIEGELCGGGLFQTSGWSPNVD